MVKGIVANLLQAKKVKGGQGYMKNVGLMTFVSTGRFFCFP